MFSGPMRLVWLNKQDQRAADFFSGPADPEWSATTVSRR